ncbi:MAG TPA: hypothetical protein VD835_05975, partial [Pyrinomonadaceae bacterium]|nr:hypothetical protein [Pyrinomonadaceae bacterium]
MPATQSRARRASLSLPVAIFFVVALLAGIAPHALFAQGAANYEAEKQRAIKLIENANATEALPILERLSN